MRSFYLGAGGSPPLREFSKRGSAADEGASGLGSSNAPGLARLAGAKFTGEYPTARIDFQDRQSCLFGWRLKRSRHSSPTMLMSRGCRLPSLLIA